MIFQIPGMRADKSGSEGGHLRPEVYFNMPTYIEKYGYEAAAEISKFEISHLEAIGDLVAREQIDCDLTVTRTFDVFLNEDHAKTSKEAYDKMIRSGITSIKDAHFTSAKQAEQVCSLFITPEIQGNEIRLQTDPI